jgi:hypothetical protein
VGVTIEWKDNIGTEGQKLSPESLMISVTAPFEQVWDMHNSLNGLPFTKKVSTAAKRRGSMMVQRKRDSPSEKKPRGPRMIKVDDGSGVAIPALKMDPSISDGEKPQQLSPKAVEMKEISSDSSPGPVAASPSETNGSPAVEHPHGSPVSDSSSPSSPVANGSPALSPTRATPPQSPKDGKPHHEKHEKHGSRALSPRDLVSEINLSKDEYFNWTMNIEPNIRLEPSLAVLTTRLCTFMGNYSYDLVTMTSPHNSRSYLFKLSFA